MKKAKNIMTSMFYALIFIISASVLTTLLSSISKADVFSNLRAATVKINGGTGSIVQGKSGAKYILTNWHVCVTRYAPHDTIVGLFHDGAIVWGDIVASDPNSDLCAAKISKKLYALKVSRKSHAIHVFTQGYPDGQFYAGAGVTKETFEWDYRFSGEYFRQCPENSQTELYKDGSISFCVLHWTSRLTTLYSRAGSSGSPILDSEGYLVGVMSSHGPDNSEGYDGGMVPVEQVRAFLDRL